SIGCGIWGGVGHGVRRAALRTRDVSRRNGAAALRRHDGFARHGAAGGRGALGSRWHARGRPTVAAAPERVGTRPARTHERPDAAWWRGRDGESGQHGPSREARAPRSPEHVWTPSGGLRQPRGTGTVAAHHRAIASHATKAVTAVDGVLVRRPA